MIFTGFHYYRNDLYSEEKGQYAKVWYNHRTKKFAKDAEFIAREPDGKMKRDKYHKKEGYTFEAPWQMVDKSEWDQMEKDYNNYIFNSH